jgi:hypothetical protein
MGLPITNPHASMTVASIQVTWNHDLGGQGGGQSGGSPLALKSASFAGSLWNWNPTIAGPTYTLTPTSTVTLPGNNQNSLLVFTFDKNYQNTDGTEQIILTLSSPECGTFQLQRP